MNNLFKNVFAKVLFVLLTLGSSAASADSFDCDENHCNLFARGTYPNLVVGEVAAVASDKEAIKVFRWAKSHGHWPTLPDDESAFVKLVQVMSIAVPNDGETTELTLLMSREEFETSEIYPGDFARYTSHLFDEPMSATFESKTARLYWDLFGCIAVLCRADDKDCPNRYAPGVYRVKDGIGLDPETGKPLTPVRKVDPETYFPL